MEVLYWSRPTDAQLAGTGLKPKHYKEPEVEVWEENWAAVQLFRDFSSQWRTGPGGPVGLDYSILQFELSRTGVVGAAYADLMDRLRIIERAALEHIHKD